MTDGKKFLESLNLDDFSEVAPKPDVADIDDDSGVEVQVNEFVLGSWDKDPMDPC